MLELPANLDESLKLAYSPSNDTMDTAKRLATDFLNYAIKKMRPDWLEHCNYDPNSVSFEALTKPGILKLESNIFKHAASAIDLDYLDTSKYTYVYLRAEFIEQVKFLKV